MAAAFSNEALSKLRTDDQLALLDSIDRLRLQGISKYVSLPQIIVCGDQSSGKSSVLEALSGVSFPIKSSLCTRFPTELVLRRAPHFSARVSIIPDESRSEGEKVSLREFRAELRGFNGLPEVVEQAKLAMGITPHGRSFCEGHPPRGGHWPKPAASHHRRPSRAHPHRDQNPNPPRR
jgi:hypothetical protein